MICVCLFTYLFNFVNMEIYIGQPIGQSIKSLNNINTDFSVFDLSLFG